MVSVPGPSERIDSVSSRPAWILSVLLGLAATLVAGVLIRPWLAGTNDPDSMSSVLYFERIVTGHHLEVTVLTTPKPLLTLLYGVAWAIFHDWRTIVWATLVVHGLTVALATRLGWRLGGPASAVFIGVALMASGAELREVAQANSLPWALLGWTIAALAVTGTPRRFGMAAIALLLAGLARIETWVILGAITAAAAALSLPPVRRRAPESWPSASTVAPILLAWLALPVMLLHDLLLTGNPFYWLSVPTAYRELTPGVGAGAHFQVALSLALLALIGAASLAMQRRWAMLIGLGGLVVGVLAFLAVLSRRGTYIDIRYFEEPTLGLLLAGAVGFAGSVAILREGLRRLAGVRPWQSVVRAPWLRAAGWVVVGIAAVGLVAHVSRPGPLAPSIDARFRTLQEASANLETVMPRMREVMAAVTTPVPAGEPAGHGFSVVSPRLATIYVPRALQRRIALELDVPLTRLADSTVAFETAPASELLQPGQYIYHDVNVDPAGLLAMFEVTQPTVLGSLQLEPVTFRQDQYWFLRVAP
jgi:hypothetical protein